MDPSRRLGFCLVRKTSKFVSDVTNLNGQRIHVKNHGINPGGLQNCQSSRRYLFFWQYVWTLIFASKNETMYGWNLANLFTIISREYLSHYSKVVPIEFALRLTVSFWSNETWVLFFLFWFNFTAFLRSLEGATSTTPANIYFKKGREILHRSTFT